jgi:hypothetical protein
MRRKEVNKAVEYSNPKHLGHEQGLDVPYTIAPIGKQETLFIEDYHERGICISIHGIRGKVKSEIWLERKYYEKLITKLCSSFDSNKT